MGTLDRDQVQVIMADHTRVTLTPQLQHAQIVRKLTENQAEGTHKSSLALINMVILAVVVSNDM